MAHPAAMEAVISISNERSMERLLAGISRHGQWCTQRQRRGYKFWLMARRPQGDWQLDRQPESEGEA